MTLASNTGHKFFITSCSTNEACDGVRCRVDIDADVFYIENVILPCENSSELVVEDSNLMSLYTTVFNETGRKPLVIRGLTIYVDAVINPRAYAMDVSVSVMWCPSHCPTFVSALH